MRWRFADDATESERKFREQATEKFDTFWNTFERNLSIIRSDDLDKCAEFLRSELAKIDARLMWELSPEIDDERRFVITPEANFFLHPMVEAMLKRAPNISGFRFMAYREPVESHNIEGLVVAKTGRWIPDLQIAAQRTDRNSIDLSFTSSEFRGKDKPEDLNYCFVLSEILFGQRFLEYWIGNIHARDRGLLYKLRSMMGRKPTSDLQSLDVNQARNSIIQVQESITNSLRAQPICKAEPPLVDRTGGGVFTWKSETARRMTCSTMEPQIIVGLNPPPQCFSSERYSRCGETFCYLKFDGSAMTVTDDSPDRGQMEEAFDLALREAAVGCVTGGGWGPIFNFIDFALADVDKAVPVLRQTSKALGLPKQTWLRFLDSSLAQEWIGMYQDTPEPDMSPGW